MSPSGVDGESVEECRNLNEQRLEPLIVEDD